MRLLVAFVFVALLAVAVTGISVRMGSNAKMARAALDKANGSLTNVLQSRTALEQQANRRLNPWGIQKWPLRSVIEPSGLAMGADGALWVAGDELIERVTRHGSTTYHLPHVRVVGIIRGPDDALWFTGQSSRNVFGRISMSGVIKMFPLPASPNVSDVPDRIVSGKHGRFWIANDTTVVEANISGAAKLYRLNRHVKGMTVMSQPSGGDELWYIADYEDYGPDFGGESPARKFVVGILVHSRPATLYTGSGTPGTMTAGGDGAVWFTTYKPNRIARITRTGNVREFPLDDRDKEPVSPDSLVWASNGTLWFTAVDSIGYVTPAGKVMDMPVPGPRGEVRASAMIAGSDHALWFAERDAVARVAPR